MIFKRSYFSNNDFNVSLSNTASLQTDILAEVEKRNLIPSKLGLIKADGEEDLLMLR